MLESDPYQYSIIYKNPTEADDVLINIMLNNDLLSERLHSNIIYDICQNFGSSETQHMSNSELQIFVQKKLKEYREYEKYKQQRAHAKAILKHLIYDKFDQIRREVEIFEDKLRKQGHKFISYGNSLAVQETGEGNKLYAYKEGMDFRSLNFGTDREGSLSFHKYSLNKLLIIDINIASYLDDDTIDLGNKIYPAEEIGLLIRKFSFIQRFGGFFKEPS